MSEQELWGNEGLGKVWVMEKDGVSELGFDHKRGVDPDPLAHPSISMSFWGNFYTSFLCHQHCLEKKRYLSGMYKIFPSVQGEISHGDTNRTQSWVFLIEHQVSNICGYRAVSQAIVGGDHGLSSFFLFLLPVLLRYN